MLRLLKEQKLLVIWQAQRFKNYKECEGGHMFQYYIQDGSESWMKTKCSSK